jgi:ribosomal protein S17E
MKTNLNEKAEKIKSIINGSAEKSKETIRELIDSNSKYLGTALDSNKKLVDSIKKQMDEQAIDDSVTTSMKKTFGKSIELAEDTLDSIINSYTRQMELNVDFNTRLVDAIKESDGQNHEKVLQLIQDNFEASRQLTIKNTKEILDFYNKHTNLALNFNEKFGENIHSQLESLFTIQTKGLHKFTEWASDWWKQNKKENA